MEMDNVNIIVLDPFLKLGSPIRRVEFLDMGSHRVVDIVFLPG